MRIHSQVFPPPWRRCGAHLCRYVYTHHTGLHRHDPLSWQALHASCSEPNCIFVQAFPGFLKLPNGTSENIERVGSRADCKGRGRQGLGREETLSSRQSSWDSDGWLPVDESSLPFPWVPPAPVETRGGYVPTAPSVRHPEGPLLGIKIRALGLDWCLLNLYPCVS